MEIINNSASVIPEMFSDMTLKNKKMELENLIYEIEQEKITLEQSVNTNSNLLDMARNNLNRTREMEREFEEDRQRSHSEAQFAFGGGREGMQDRYIAMQFMSRINPHTEYVCKAAEEVSKAQMDKSAAQSSISECNRSVLKYQAQLRDLENLLRETPAKRTEDYYQQLLYRKKSLSEPNDLLEIAKKFRELEGYKDTEALAVYCENRAQAINLKRQYDKLIQAKNQASSEDSYYNLIAQFRDMKGYEDTNELAKECFNRYSALKKNRYDKLVQAKNQASSEDGYYSLIVQFRDMKGYEDTDKLANECEKQYNVLKEDREERERKAREAEQKRLEEDLLAKRRAEEAKKRNARIGVFLQCCLIISYLYILFVTYIISALWGADGNYIAKCLPLAIFSLLIGVISTIFLRKSNYGSGVFIVMGMILVQSITTAVWEGLGFLALRFLLNTVIALAINTLSALPGFVLACSEFPDKESKVHGSEESNKKNLIIAIASIIVVAILGVVLLNSNDNKTVPVQQEEPIAAPQSKPIKSVQIGNQTWMVENLNDASKGGKCQDDNPSNCEKYGRLYTWEEAKKACPSGWHLPSDAEWTALANFAGGDKIAGGKLKAKSGWSNNGNGTDDYGFSLTPDGDGEYSRLWSSTEHNASNAWRRRIDYDGSTVLRDSQHKVNLYSVRCVKD